MSEIPTDILNKSAEHVNNMPDRPPFKGDMLDAIARAIMEERDRCAKIAADEAEFAFNTYEGSRLHDFMSVAKHIEAQIMMKPHPRDNMRRIIYKNSARIISEP